MFASLLVIATRVGSAEEESPGSLLGRDHLTGDWGGVRSWLEDRGLTFEFDYSLEVLSNVSGGRRRGTSVLGNADLLFTLQTEPLLDWQGGKLFLYGLGNHGGDPSDDVGDVQIASNIEAFDTWKLYEAWFEQRLFEDRFSVLLGLYDLNSELQVVPVGELFLNSSHGIGAESGASGVNGPSIFPTTSLGARVELRPTESLYLRAAVLDGVPGDPEEPRGTQVILRQDDGLLLAYEVGFIRDPKQEVSAGHAYRDGERPTVASGGLDGGYLAKFALGAWGYTTEFEDFYRVGASGRPIRRRGTFGVYLIAEHQAFRERLDSTQGLTAFARLGLADERVNPVDGYVGCGLVYRGLIPGRDRDRLGVAVAAAHFSEDLREALRRAGESSESWEVALEFTYRLPLTPWLWVQPDVQYIVNPGGSRDLDDAVVAGARAMLCF